MPPFDFVRFCRKGDDVCVGMGRTGVASYTFLRQTQFSTWLSPQQARYTTLTYMAITYGWVAGVGNSKHLCNRAKNAMRSRYIERERGKESCIQRVSVPINLQYNFMVFIRVLCVHVQCRMFYYIVWFRCLFRTTMAEPNKQSTQRFHTINKFSTQYFSFYYFFFCSRCCC